MHINSTVSVLDGGNSPCPYTNLHSLDLTMVKEASTDKVESYRREIEIILKEVFPSCVISECSAERYVRHFLL